MATNLAALGPGRVAVLGVRGDDGFGFELDRSLAERGINPELMVKIKDWHTFTYTKVINSETGIEDKPRLDFISTKPLPAQAEEQVLHNLRSAIVAYDAILVADQAETNAGGVVTPAVRSLIIELATKYPEKVFLVDSRLRADLFRKVTHQAESAGGGSCLPEALRRRGLPAPAATRRGGRHDGDARFPGRTGGRGEWRKVEQSATHRESRGHLRGG